MATHLTECQDRNDHDAYQTGDQCQNQAVADSRKNARIGKDKGKITQRYITIGHGKAIIFQERVENHISQRNEVEKAEQTRDTPLQNLSSAAI